MTNILALTLVLLATFYFLSLAVVAFAAPARVTRFLFGFASTAGAHYRELTIRNRCVRTGSGCTWRCLISIRNVAMGK